MKHLVMLSVVLGIATFANAALLSEDFVDISEWTSSLGAGTNISIASETCWWTADADETLSQVVSFGAQSTLEIKINQVTWGGGYVPGSISLYDASGNRIRLGMDANPAGNTPSPVIYNSVHIITSSGMVGDDNDTYDVVPSNWFVRTYVLTGLGTSAGTATINGDPIGTTFDFSVVGDITTVKIYGKKKMEIDNLIISVPSAPPAVTGRYVFYNNSAWDGNNPAPNTADYSAIATNKTALLPGEIASFINYTSYWRGINGVIVDIARAPSVPLPGDFTFKVGNVSDPSGFTTAPEPVAINFRRYNGRDRAMITFADGAIAGKWLQVTVKATATTGLPADDVFYFGNAPGDTGNSATDAEVTPADEISVRNNQATLAVNPAGIDDAYDFNRDKKVGPTDQIIGRNNGTNSSTALQLITVP